MTLRCVPAFTLRGLDAPAPAPRKRWAFEEARARQRPFRVSFVFPMDAWRSRPHEQPHRAAKAAQPAGRIRERRALANHAFGDRCRAGRACPGASADQPARDAAGRAQQACRATRLQIFSSHASVRFTEDGCATASTRRRPSGKVLETIERRGFTVPFDRGAHGGGRRCLPQHRCPGRDQRLRQQFMPRHGLGSVLPRQSGEAIMERAGRQAALESATADRRGRCAPRYAD